MSLNSVARLTGVVAVLYASPVMVFAQSESHANLQAVTSTGTSAWEAPEAPFNPPVTIRGVLLCNPDEMLDSSPDFLPWNNGANQFRLGGEWQVALQAIDAGDRGGTFCYMAQNYGNRPEKHNDDFSYANEAWVAEVLRLSHDPGTMRKFRAGDLVEVTARQALFYGGKRNVNEGHDTDPAFNFELRLVTADYGLPGPETIELAEVMQPGGVASDRSTWLPIFDQTRATGAERYQGTRVRLNNLTLVSANGWNPTNTWANRLCTVTDGADRFFSLRHPRYSLGETPTNLFDAIGVFNQESGSGGQGTNGYELFVQQIIPQTAPSLGAAQVIALTWPVSGAVYQLEHRLDLNSADWVPVTNAPVVIDGLNTVLAPPTAYPRQVYRLRKTN